MIDPKYIGLDTRALHCLLNHFKIPHENTWEYPTKDQIKNLSLKVLLERIPNMGKESVKKLIDWL